MIYRLCRRDEWERAQALGTYAGGAADERDGFLHFSTAEQVAESARRHMAGVVDLLLLTVPASALGDALRWEPSRDGQLFPHLYSVLSVDLIVDVAPMPLGEDGRHRLPTLTGRSG